MKREESFPSTLSLSSGSAPAHLPHGVSTILRFTVFTLAFILAYLYGMSFHHFGAAPFWPPDAVLLTALLLAPRRRWWLLLILPLPIRLLLGVPPNIPMWFLLSVYINDSLKALLAATVIRRLNPGIVRLERMQDLFQFFAIAVVITPMLSAFGGALSRVALGDSYWIAWRRWFLGDALANLIVTPMILFWASAGLSAIKTATIKRVLESALVFGILVVLGFELLGTARLSDSTAFIYLPFPVLLYIAVRFGPAGTSAGISLIAAITIWRADHGVGPFSSTAAHGYVLPLQLFLAVISVSLLCLAVVLREMKQGKKDLQRLTGQLIGLRDEEQRRIAAELHDGLGQTLSLISTRVSLCRDSISSPESALKQLEHISEITLSAVDEVREIAHNLRPHELDLLGLKAALESIVNSVAAVTSVEVSAHFDNVNGLLPASAETSIYRILQEGLRNVIRHAEASKAHLEIRRADKHILISIQDNGKGMVDGPGSALGRIGGGFGLPGITERVRVLGGTFSIDSKPGRGTTLLISIDAAERDESSPSYREEDESITASSSQLLPGEQRRSFIS